MTARGLWILIVVVLAPAVVVPLIVPIYDRIDPTLLGFRSTSGSSSRSSRSPRD